ncbi:putative nuclease HARBI1 [Centroberyx affinis]|uniref:putative nuclease HARBI1 n=1 Tax=Centroberyx affinis TaxID=166261 RepID=UPI003A5BBABA
MDSSNTDHAKTIPHEREWEFVNRKGRHSINVQLVVNADLIITNCVVKWPGSVHDARLLRESHIFRHLQQKPPDGIILGDSVYQLLPWLMTPFAMVNNDAEERFNCAHGRTRSTIECLNGVLKRRSACLNYLPVDPQRACNIILACIVLHYIAEERKVPHCDGRGDHSQPQADRPDLPLAALQPDGAAGRSMRDALMNHYFT